MAENIQLVNLLSNIHLNDLKSFAKEKSDFTIISLHDASPDYISLGGEQLHYHFLDFLTKSSLCQDAIINKFYSSFNQDILDEKIQNTLETSNNVINQFENNILFGNRKKFSFYYSLLEKSQKYFVGDETTFGYSLNKLNINSDNIKNFFSAQIKNQSFKTFFRNSLGFNHRDDVITSHLDNLELVSDEEIFAITENTALLSIAQLLNLTLFEGNNKSLTHSTELFNRQEYNDPNRYLTFNKREAKHINTIVGNSFNSYIHLNYFDREVSNIDAAIFNIKRQSNILSTNPYSSEILETNFDFTPANISNEDTLNRNSNFIDLDTLNLDVPDAYQIFMKPILKVNSSITSLGILKENREDRGNYSPDYRGQSPKTFIQNSNIEINNILFGYDSSDSNKDLSWFIQSTKKKISSARKSLSRVFFNSLEDNDTLISFLYQKSNVNNTLMSKLGVTYSDVNSSFISRQENNSKKDLFIYENVDIFESNNYLTNKSGYTYFNRGTITELQNVINKHEEEKNKIESLVDLYHQSNISNTNIYKDILSFASEGVRNSLSRFHESNIYEYGNLPVHLLEEVAFMSRFTGNKNHNLETLTFEQEEFKNQFANLLYAGANNKNAINSLIDKMPNSIKNKVLAENLELGITDIKSLAYKIDTTSGNIDEFLELLNLGSTADFSRNTNVAIRYLIQYITANNNVPENDFRRYAKDLNSDERNSNNIISPRYFSVCGIPFPDIYSGNRVFANQRFMNESLLDRYSKGFETYYIPFVGFILKSNSQLSIVNTFHEINKENGILSQLTKSKTGVISSYISFLEKYFNLLNITTQNTNDIDIINFIKYSFEAYCHIVIAKFSQTFEYSTILNAVKIHSEGPVDVMCGVDPGDLSNYLPDTTNVGDYVVALSQGFGGSDPGDEFIDVNDNPVDLGPTSIQKARSLPQNGYGNFMKRRIMFPDANGGARFRDQYDEFPLNERNLQDRAGNNIQSFGQNYQGGMWYTVIRSNRRWLYPYHEDLSSKIPKNQLVINYYNKFDVAENPSFVEGWNDRTNQLSARPSTLENILKTIYHNNAEAEERFLDYCNQNDFTDEIYASQDPNFEFSRTLDTKFTGGVFNKEIFTWNSIEDANDGINEQPNNDNEYVEDLLQEARQYLYYKNIVVTNIPVPDDVKQMNFFDIDNIYILYWSQYNSNYPILHTKNYIYNVYRALVEKPYLELSSKLNTSFMPEISEAENRDAIFNIINKIHAGVLSEDISISYLFDAYRYAFMHMNEYKNYLESPVINEETGEEELNSEELQESIGLITEIVAKHYDDPTQFTFRDYISKIDTAQNALIKFYSQERINNLLRIQAISRRPSDHRNHFNDANNFYNIFLKNRSDYLNILCIGMKENAVNTINKIIKIEVFKYDSIAKVYSDPWVIRFKFDYFVPESLGTESDYGDYNVIEYNFVNKSFSQVADNAENIEFRYNHINSFLARKYLTTISGFGMEEKSLKIDLQNTKASKSEKPRVFTNDLELLNTHMSTLNDEYNEMLTFSQNIISEDGEFSNIQNNIDYNVENDVYTDIIETNIKNKQDIYKRLIQFDYQNMSINSLGEIYMPKEFTKIFYIPLRDSYFYFQGDLARQSNNYSLKVNVSFE